MGRIILYNKELKQRVLLGVQKLAFTVALTMGPKGKNVLLGSTIGFGSPLITKDGVSVARQITLDDPFEEIGCQLVKEVAGRTADVAGDGTTTATVLAHKIYESGMALTESGYNPIHFRKGIEWALDEFRKEISKEAVPVSSSEDIQNIATISCNGDVALATVIAKAYEAVGETGIVSAVAVPGAEHSFTVQDGIELKSGYINSNFLEKNKSSWDATNCVIMVCNKELTHLSDCGPLLSEVYKRNKPLLIVAKDLKKEAAEALYKNAQTGRLNCCFVKIPVFGKQQNLWVEDFCSLVGARLVDDEAGIPLSALTFDELGTAKSVVVTNNSTKILGGGKNEELVAKKIESYNKDELNLISESDRRDLRARISFLSAKSAQIQVGYYNELELREKGDRAEDATCAIRAAMEEGILPGGGVTLFKISHRIESKLSSIPNHFHDAAKVLLHAARAPFYQILKNASTSEADVKIIENRIIESSDFAFGWDAAENRYGNLFDLGIIDPKKVTRVALENATSIALLLLTSEAAIVDDPEKQSTWQPPAGWRPPSDTNLTHKY